MIHIQFERSAPSAFQFEKQEQVMEFHGAIDKKTCHSDSWQKGRQNFRSESAFPAMIFQNFPQNRQSQKNTVAVSERGKKSKGSCQPKLFAESVEKSRHSQKQKHRFSVNNVEEKSRRKNQHQKNRQLWINFWMKLFQEFEKIGASSEQKSHAQNPTRQNKISEKNCANNFYKCWIEWKKSYIGKSIVSFQIVSIMHDVQIPIGIPAIVHIHKIPALDSGKTFWRDPFVGRVGTEIETIECHKAKNIYDYQPQKNQ